MFVKEDLLGGAAVGGRQHSGGDMELGFNPIQSLTSIGGASGTSQEDHVLKVSLVPATLLSYTAFSTCPPPTIPRVVIACSKAAPCMENTSTLRQ